MLQWARLRSRPPRRLKPSERKHRRPACAFPFRPNSSDNFELQNNRKYIRSLVMPFFFDRDAEFQVHRRNLPHWTQSAVTYFVTFHLADSLPVKKLAEFEAERKRWLET